MPDDLARAVSHRPSAMDDRGGGAVSVAAPAAGSQEDVAAELALLAKALGHPARVRILRLLLARDSCFCGELVDELPLAQATVSQHLKVLKQAGLIQGEIDGLRTCYCASLPGLEQLHRLIGRLLEEAAGRR
jgi:ArsR family transcriptional regulator, arsenate/arsenite/antimonite-responsive transcriptional repressor